MYDVTSLSSIRREMLIISRRQEENPSHDTSTDEEKKERGREGEERERERDSSNIKSRCEFCRVSEEALGFGLAHLVTHRTVSPIINIRGPNTHKFIELS